MGKYLIVGGSGGIGSAIGKRLKDAGHDLILAGRNEDTLKKVAGDLDAETIQCDVTDTGSIQSMAQSAGDTLDGLVYAVGTINLKPFEKLTDDELETDFTLNALGAARVVRACLPALKKAENGASVLMFSTVAVEQGFAAHTGIAMAKGAVVGLMRTLATEYAPDIRVNCIAPSLIQTPLSEKVTSSEKMADAVAKMHPIPRLGQAEDIAGMGETLLTEKGSWITGQVIGIDGGRSRLRVMRT